MNNTSETSSIIIIEGPDHSGKTTFAKTLSEKLKISVYKDKSGTIEKDWKCHLTDWDFSKEEDLRLYTNSLLGVYTLPLSYEEGIIFDRGLASSVVYGQVLRKQENYYTQRAYDIDDYLSSNDRFLNIIFIPNVERAKESCSKSDVSNAPIGLDCPDSLVAKHYEEIVQGYEDFSKKTKVKTIVFKEDKEVGIRGNIYGNLWKPEHLDLFYQKLSKAQKKPHENKQEFYSFEKYQQIVTEIVLDFVKYI